MQIQKVPVSFGWGVYKQSWYEAKGFRLWFALLLLINSLPLLLPVFIPGLSARYPFVSYIGNFTQQLLIAGLYLVDEHFDLHKKIEVSKNFAIFTDHKLFYRLLPWLMAYALWNIMYYYLNTFLVKNNLPDLFIFALSLVVAGIGAVFTQFVMPLMVLAKREVGDAFVFAIKGGAKNIFPLLITWVLFYFYMTIALCPMGLAVYVSKARPDLSGGLPLIVFCSLLTAVMLGAGLVFFSSGLLYSPYLMYKRVFKKMSEV